MTGPLEVIDQLRATLGRLESALSLVDDAIVWADARGVVQWCNASFDRLVGRPHIDVVGRELAEILPVEQGGRPVLAPGALLDEPQSDGRAAVYELRDRVVEIVSRHGTIPNGKIVVVIRDVTDRARAEEAARRLRAQLEAANRELEAFAYSASHDLRAPLRSIDGFSQVLLDEHAAALPAEAQHYLRRIRAGAQRMAQLIDDMLRLSRISRAEMSRDDVDVSSLARSIVQELQRSEPERRVEISIEEDLRARADERLLRIALENLLGNAWKFTARTERAQIAIGASEADGERTFFVRDNGAGFDMTYGRRLFTPFQRLHSVSEFPGAGVGLATVQRIVHRHGGRIWAEGRVGAGATFRFTLPAPQERAGD